MAKLVFEIWKCEKYHSFECSPVSEASDKLRASVSPNAELLYSFSAETDHEAMQKNYDFQELGLYKPGGFPDRCFTEQEEREQQIYLNLRSNKSAEIG